MKTGSIFRNLAIGIVLSLGAIHIIIVRSHYPCCPEWLTFTCVFYTTFILLMSIGFGILGTFVGSTLSIVMTIYIYIGTKMDNPWIWILTFTLLAIVLYFYFSHFQKESIQKRIILHNLESQWNDSSEKYSKNKAVVRSYKNKITRYSTLRQFGEKLASTLSLDEIAKRTIELTVELIGKGDQYSLFLLDDNLKTFTLAHLIRITDKGKEFPIDPTDPFNHWIIKNRQNLLIEDLQLDFRFEDAIKGSPIASLIAVPLITENKLIGAIRIESHISRNFQPDDLRILATLASIISTSLRNIRLYNETLELSIKDGLTGLYVSTYFHQELHKAFTDARQNNRPLSVLMADIDNFKKVNDRFGHTVGDSILKRISDIFHQTIDSNYIPTRYGGEEFSAFFQNWDLDKVREIAEIIREKVEKIPLEIRREEFHVTISIGICKMDKNDPNKDTLLQRADQALYEAKRLGKNRVCKDSSL